MNNKEIQKIEKEVIKLRSEISDKEYEELKKKIKDAETYRRVKLNWDYIQDKNVSARQRLYYEEHGGLQTPEMYYLIALKAEREKNYPLALECLEKAFNKIEKSADITGKDYEDTVKAYKRIIRKAYDFADKMIKLDENYSIDLAKRSFELSEKAKKSLENYEKKVEKNKKNKVA